MERKRGKQPLVTETSALPQLAARGYTTIDAVKAKPQDQKYNEKKRTTSQ